MLRGTPYVSYSYAYPHKTAYRPLEPAASLGELWAGERREALFLYVHVPFCEMRCGFCNLFTAANPREEIEQAYLDTLERHAGRVREALGSSGFARMAVGGGTPTYLSVRDLARLFRLAAEMGVDLRGTPISVETSPGTAERDKLRLLHDSGVDRISIGVQSFIESEAHAVGRAQRTSEVHAALGTIREAGFPTLNIDLIYGLPGQTVESWLFSLQAALKYEPEELYLYPLYNRPLTGLGRMAKEWDDIRLECYKAGRALLIDEGYSQVSMRMFRAAHAPSQEGPVYCCQEDGMVGVGCGARSYTHALHYSSEYAVSARGVRGILNDYIAQPDEAFDVAAYGYRLDEEDQRRRYVIQSLLQAEGLELAAYERRFGSELFSDLPQMHRLSKLGFAARGGGFLRLTEYGLERSDTIGPWLCSEQARRLSEAYELR